MNKQTRLALLFLGTLAAFHWLLSIVFHGLITWKLLKWF